MKGRGDFFENNKNNIKPNSMHYFKDLKVWNLSMDLIVDLYKITKLFPSEEKFGLVSQINRSSVSIAANIAEGCGRNTPNDFNHFLDIALGSSFELETHILISQRIEILEEQKAQEILQNINSIQKMLNALRRSNK
jgi:four helix bundle protein